MVTPTLNDVEQNPNGASSDSWTSRKHNGVINVKKWRDDFSFSDAGAAVNDILDNAPEHVLWFPGGTYAFDTRVLFTDADISGGRRPIHLQGAGPDAVTITSSLSDAPIVVGNFNRPNRWSMDGFKCSLTSLGANNSFIYLGSDNTYGGDGDKGPYFPRIDNCHFIGSNTTNQVRSIWMQNSFWLREVNNYHQSCKLYLGKGTKNWANSGYHRSCHYIMHETNGGDMGVESTGSVVDHTFIRCKATGQTRPLDLGSGGGRHFIQGLDQENSSGKATTVGNGRGTIWLNVKSAVEPGVNDTLIDTPADAVPRQGSLLNNTASWIDSVHGPGMGYDANSITSFDSDMFHDTNFPVFAEKHDFSGSLPGIWNETHSGGGVETKGIIDGIELTTGASSGNIARIETTEYFDPRRNPLCAIRVTPLDSADAIYRFKFNSPAWSISLDHDTATDTDWLLNGTTTGVTFAADDETKIRYTLYPNSWTGAGAVGDDITSAAAGVLNSNGSGEHDNEQAGFDSTTSNHIAKLQIEVETGAAADKRLRLHSYRDARRDTNGQGL